MQNKLNGTLADQLLQLIFGREEKASKGERRARNDDGLLRNEAGDISGAQWEGGRSHNLNG